MRHPGYGRNLFACFQLKVTVRALNHVLKLVANLCLKNFVVETPLLVRGRASVDGVDLLPVRDRFILTLATRQ